MDNISKVHSGPMIPEQAPPKKVIESVKGPQTVPGTGKFPTGYKPTKAELELTSTKEVEKKVEKKVAGPPPQPILLGTVHIEAYSNVPYKVEFTEVQKGVFGASQVTMAWRHMLKAYRVWKGKEAMRGFEQGSPEEIQCEGYNCENTLGIGKHKKFHNKWLCKSCIERDLRGN